jgi:phage shock protein A
MGWSIVIMLVVSVLGSAGISSLLTVKSLNRRTLSEAKKAGEDADLADANSRKVVSEASALLIEPLLRRAKALEEQLTAAQAEVQELRGQVAAMSKEMVALSEENVRLRRDGP